MISCCPGSAPAAVAPSSSDGAGPGGDPERDQRPVPVRAEPGEQLAELLIGDAARGPLGTLGRNSPARPGGTDPSDCGAPSRRPGRGQRERIHHRAGPRLQVDIVKVPADRLAVRRRRRPRTRLASASRHRDFRGPPGLPAISSHRQKSRASALVTWSHAGPDSPAEPEPPQQGHPIGPLRRLRTARACRSRRYADTGPTRRRRVDQPDGSHGSPVSRQRTRRGTTSEPRSRQRSSFSHEQGPSTHRRPHAPGK